MADASLQREPLLKLDPGRPTPKIRKPRSATYRLSYKALAFLALALLGYLGTSLVRYLLFVPHSDMYYRTRDKTSPDEVIKSFIAEDETFDILATVWIRDDDVYTYEPPGSNAGIEGSPSKVLRERAIFLGTVFRRVKLSDKGLETRVPLQIPTAIFKKPELTHTDLRASFVLVPNEPSAITRITNYSSWIPVDAMHPPTVYPPHGFKPCIIDWAINAYGTFVPLLTFNNIKPRCPFPGGEEGTLGEIDQDEYAKEMWKIVFAENRPYLSTQGKPAHRAHPYIITRTLLGVVDMTKPLNRTAYEHAYAKLAETACGLGELKRLGLSAERADWGFCRRTYRANGNHEVMIQRSPQKPLENESKNASEWFYAPYMKVQNLWGPLDLIPVPVDRERCANGAAEGSDNEILNLTWTIVFSGIPPGKKILGYPFATKGQLPTYDMTSDEETLKIQQSLAEFTQAAHGYKPYKNRHPILGYFLFSSEVILLALETLLNAHYWYFRAGQSTVGISVIGTAFIAAACFIRYITEAILDAIASSSSFWPLTLSMFMASVAETGTPLMLKAISKARIKTIWILIPISIRFMDATHAERASRRVESKVSWKEILFILAFFRAILTLADHKNFYIINPRTLPRESGLSSWGRAARSFRDFSVEPLLMCGQVLQLVMNKQSGTFAGTYKISAFLGFARLIVDLLSHLPLFKFIVELGSGVSLFGLLKILYYGTLVLQAMRYPKAQDAEEEDDE
ncbi:hypothetical protein CPC08DRAFT_767400 [Agrocybe pediades]|nr:hypothetical protein CPC08DRAFT_767400 [Agrocybe pediades]